MALIRLIISFSLLFASCLSDSNNEGNIEKEKLSTEPINNGYAIYLKDSSIVQLLNIDSLGKTQLLFSQKTVQERINLDFYITQPYIGEVNMLHVKGMGQAIAIESFIAGASGLSANITNVSIIFIEGNFKNKAFSFSSFNIGGNGGIDLLEYNNNKLVADIYQYQSTDDSNNAIYCKYLFELTPKGFIMQDVFPKCLTFSHANSSIKKYNCRCEKLKKPYVN